MRFVLLLSLLAVPALASSLDKQLIRKVIQSRSRDFQRCYEQALTRDGPATAGKIVLKLDVESTGEVASAATEASWASWEFKDCLETAARKLVFPKGPEKFHITYPFFFKAADPAPVPAKPDAGR